jgi:hypothetical protein
MKLSRKEREEREIQSELEAGWFYGSLRGQAGNASPLERKHAIAMDTALRSISTFHRGALSLWFTEKAWPEALRQEYGPAASLVVRLACATAPSVGSTDAVEAVAVKRLLAWMAGESEDEALEDLDFRAEKHFRLALRALAKALPATTREEEAPASGVVPARSVTESA